jgi:hypothetical protein
VEKRLTQGKTMARHNPTKIKMAELMLSGSHWQVAAQQAGVVTSRSSAYRFLTAYCVYGEKALEERRRGHAHKGVSGQGVWLITGGF